MDFSPDRPAFFINPDYRPMAGAAKPVIDPATLETVGADRRGHRRRDRRGARPRRPRRRRVEAARRQEPRAKHLHAVANAIEAADLTRCAELMVREMGKPYPEAIGEIANCAPIFRYYAEMARDEAGKIAGTTQAGSFQYARYEPLRRLRPHHALQLSDPADVLDGRRLAGGRQRLRHQAGRGDDAVDARLHDGVPLACRRAWSPACRAARLRRRR